MPRTARTRPPKTPHPPVVFVEWIDSRTIVTEWTDRGKVYEEGARFYPQRIVSAGLLLEAGKEYIMLSVGIAPNDDVMHVLQIPTSQVRRLDRLKKKRGMKRIRIKQGRLR